MPKNVTFELNRPRPTVRKGICFITSERRQENTPSALLISSEKIIARDASLGADGA
jgi:hypothetical protein